MQLAVFPCCGVVNMHRAGVWIRVILYSSSIHPQPDQVQITSDIAHFHAINGNHYRGGQTVFGVNCRWFVGDTDTHLTPCGPVASKQHICWLTPPCRFRTQLQSNNWQHYPVVYLSYNYDYAKFQLWKKLKSN